MAPLALPHGPKVLYCLNCWYSVISWYLYQPESHQSSLNNINSALIDRTLGLPGSDKNLPCVADGPWHSGDLCCPCDFLSLICSSIVQLCTKCTWPTPPADGSSFKCPYLGVAVYPIFPGGQEGPGDDQLLLLLHNLFKCFIYNRCDRWAKLNIKKWWFDFWSYSTYQPREGGGWHWLRGHWSQLRRHQCVSLYSSIRRNSLPA